MAFRWTAVLFVLATLGAVVAPRLSAATPDEMEAESPCFRWGALECCYVDE